jgi:hypothetical protein
VDAIAGVGTLLAVVPNVTAPMPDPVFRIATRNARVDVFGTICRALEGEVVRLSA